MQIVGGLATLIILVILYRIFHHSTQVQVLRPLTTDTPTASIIIPAYNEENSIERTIRSLMNQTYKPKYVVVVANNCSDRTAEVVTGLQTEYDNLLLDVMDNNPDKKSGALNRALEVLSAAAGLTHQEALAHFDRISDIIISVDADTVFGPDHIEITVKEFKNHPKWAGLCSRFGVLPLNRNAPNTKWYSPWMVLAQKFEYNRANDLRVSSLNKGNAKVLAGCSSSYRSVALKQVMQMRSTPEKLRAWATDSIVEDYTMTNDYKRLGWQVGCAVEQYALTDVPYTLKDFKQQRMRWYFGTVEQDRKEQTGTLFEHIVLLSSISVRYIWLLLIIYWVRHNQIEWNSLYLILPAISLFWQWDRARNIPDKTWRQRVLLYTLISDEIYNFIKELIWLKVYAVAFLNFSGVQRLTRRPIRTDW